MRLTKRQLKKIIREEYSRLKRRGLIREMADQPMMGGRPLPRYELVDEMRLYIDELVMQADQDFGAYEMDDDRMGEYQGPNVEDPAYMQAELHRAFPDATPEEIEEAMGSW